MSHALTAAQTKTEKQPLRRRGKTLATSLLFVLAATTCCTTAALSQDGGQRVVPVPDLPALTPSSPPVASQSMVHPTIAPPTLGAPDAALPGLGAQNKDVPLMGRPVMGGFILSGGLPDWSFRLGPIGYPQMNLKLVRANTDHSGSVGFLCEQQTGRREMALALPGGFVGSDMSQDIMVMVGNQGAKLKTTVQKKPGPNEPTLYDAEGQGISDILSAMGRIDPSFITASIVYDDLHGHRVAFGIPNPRGVSEIAAKICDGWHSANTKRISEGLRGQADSAAQKEESVVQSGGAQSGGAQSGGAQSGGNKSGDANSGADILLGGIHAPQ